jgi:hypothetical protein
MEVSGSFTLLFLYPLGKRELYPLDGRFAGTQHRSGSCGEVKNLVLLGIEPGPSLLYRPSCSDTPYISVKVKLN